MEETIDVAPSAESGNVPAESIMQPAATPVTPAEPVEPAKPAETPTPELFELPDGRKVDGTTLTREWKENFLPDYTRKSQELAKVKTETLPDNKPANNTADPNWQPQSYDEIIRIAEERAVNRIESKEQARIQARQELESTIATQISEIRKIDPNLNENSLFHHATKYGFRDLKVAYQNLKDFGEIAKKVQQTTVANIAKRSDPVSNVPGATGARPNPSLFGSARDYLRSLNNK